ncbi:unnamed protein product [Paramecium primaurelia]|uniref:Uncharacterized protein n=1 Tax=Paramecium primaurelia TaxID=5886 RepID=A0A8S1KLD1_PARPR|nr:unnamed protein product [Paramecium primaurelia]
MNITKQKLESLFDLSIIIEKIKILDEQQSNMFHLTKRPNYQLQKQSNTEFIPHIINDFEIKRKFKEIQNDSFLSWKPHIIRTNQKISQKRPSQISKVSPSPKPLELSVEKKIHSTTFMIKQNNKIRTKSTDQRIKLRKIETKDIEAQFLETRNLINRFNRIKRKAVRFNILT